MAFLDNSGDIILDAVLTDAGRKRMAEGNFDIAKYAFGDDEINYAQFNSDDARGEAYYDLEIMQTPILEAFTNNAASMSSFLMTVSQNFQDQTHLPILRLNENWGLVGGQASLGQNAMAPQGPATTSHTGLARGNFTSGEPAAGGTTISTASQVSSGLQKGTFIVTVNNKTEDIFKLVLEEGQNQAVFGTAPADPNFGCMIPQGVILGSPQNYQSRANKNYICIDQGIDNDPVREWSDMSSMKETMFLVEVDSRFCEICPAPKINSRNVGLNTVQGPSNRDNTAGAAADFSFVDDDFMATYILEGPSFITDVYGGFAGVADFDPAEVRDGANGETNNWVAAQVFKNGPVGKRLQFSLKATAALARSDNLFLKYGSRTKLLSRFVPDGNNAASPFNPTSLPYVKLGAGGTVGYQVGIDMTSADAKSAGAHATVAAQAGLAIPVYFIDSMIRVTGFYTGQSIDIPVRFVRKVEA